MTTQAIIAMIILGIGLAVCAVMFGAWLIGKVRSTLASHPVKGGDLSSIPAVVPPAPAVRSADTPASDETTAYINDIIKACNKAPAEFTIGQLQQGVSRDVAKANWIEALWKMREPEPESKALTEGQA